MNDKEKLAIFGSSGHASDVADIAISCHYAEIIFLTAEKDKTFFCGFPVEMDSEETVYKLSLAGYHFAIGIGSSKIRRLIAERYPDLFYPILLHSSVTTGNCLPPFLSDSKGTILAAGARITNNVSIGNFCFMGVNSVIGHDCVIHDYVSIMPGAVLSGNVTVKEQAYIGSNAAIRQGTPEKRMIIGENSVIGMGGVVLKDIPDNHMATGVPTVNFEIKR